MAKIILTHEVTGLGEPGDVVEVKDGYARNFLLPRKLATPWTKGAEKQVADIRAARKAREIANLDDARALRDALQGKAIKVTAAAGASGRLFGAISTSDIAKAAAAQGHAIDSKKVQVGNPIKTTGDYQVQVRLHPEVSATLKLKVVAAS